MDRFVATLLAMTVEAPVIASESEAIQEGCALRAPG